MSITGVVVNGQIQLPADVHLPEGTQIQIVTDPPELPGTFAERYARYIGIVDDAPADLAANHDHYLYATSRQSP